MIYLSSSLGPNQKEYSSGDGIILFLATRWSFEERSDGLPWTEPTYVEGVIIGGVLMELTRLILYESWWKWAFDDAGRMNRFKGVVTGWSFSRQIDRYDVQLNRPSWLQFLL